MKWFPQILVSVCAFGIYFGYVLQTPAQEPLWTLFVPLSVVVGWSVFVAPLLAARDRLRSPEHKAFLDLVEEIHDSSKKLGEREQLLARHVAQNKKVAPKLLDDLFDEDEALRPAVVRAWGRLRHEPALPAICAAIDGSDARLGSSIAVALGVFDSPASRRASFAYAGEQRPGHAPITLPTGC